MLDWFKKSELLQKVLLVLVCLALYGQTLGFAYVWDDGLIFLSKNSLVVEPLSWRLLTEPILERTSYMRPLVLLSWWTEFQLFGQRPAVSHGVNIAVLVVNVLLLRAVTRRVLEVRGAAMPGLWATVAALCYAVHPALIESTAWVSGRFDMLATTGVLAAVLVMTSGHMRMPARVFGVLVFTSVALMSKELGVVTPVVLFCLWMATFADEQQPLGQNIMRALRSQAPIWISSVILLLCYFVLRRMSMGVVYHASLGPEYALWLLKTMLPVESLKFYATMVVWPFGRVGIFHPFSDLKHDVGALIGNLLTVALILGLLWQALRRQRPWAWLLMAALTGIALVLHFVPMSIADNYVQDRFMTLPLAFVAMALACFPWRTAVADRLHLRTLARKTTAVLSLGGWLVFATIVTASLLPLWSRPELLWRWASHQYPDIINIRHNYMQAALESGHHDWVQTEIDRLIKKNGGLEVGEQTIYAAMLIIQRNPESLKYLEGVLLAFPKFHEMPNGRAQVDTFILSPQAIGAAYTNYALAMLLFKGDAEAALRYSQVAHWYLGKIHAGPQNYIEAAIYYSLGDVEKAEAIVKANESIYYDNKATLISQMRLMPRVYCREWKDTLESARVACDRLQKSGFFDHVK